MIHEPLAFGALDRVHGALSVIDPIGDPVIPKESRLINVALQMPFTDGVVSTIHLALHDGMEALSSVDVDEAAEPYILPLAVIDASVAAVVLGRLHVNGAFVRDQIALLIHAGRKMLFDVFSRDIRNVLRADFAIAFNECHDRVLLRDRLVLVRIRRLAADISFVALDYLVLTADRAARFGIETHSFTNAHRKKPRALVRDAKHPVKLMRGNTLLRSGHKVKAENPLRERDLRALHHGVDCYRERLLAVIAMDETGTVALASHPGDALGIAMRANGTVRPPDALKMSAGRVFVVENRVRKIDRHGMFLTC